MGWAHASCDVNFYGVEDFLEATAHMLRVLVDRWVQPRSLLVYVPGGHADTFAKLPGSIDGPLAAIRPHSERLLPGECLIDNGGLTVLEPSESHPSWPRDFDSAMALVEQCADRANRLRRLGEDPHASVYGSFWGSTRIVLPVDGDLVTSWGLRERISFSNGDLLEPIAAFHFDCEAAADSHTENTFAFGFCSWSHIWRNRGPCSATGRCPGHVLGYNTSISRRTRRS